MTAFPQRKKKISAYLWDSACSKQRHESGALALKAIPGSAPSPGDPVQPPARPPKIPEISSMNWTPTAPSQMLPPLLLEASRKLWMKWNCAFALEIALCGCLYTSGLQAPQLMSLQILLKATRRGLSWHSSITGPEVRPRIQDMAPSPAHRPPQLRLFTAAHLECTCLPEAKNNGGRFLRCWVL